MYKYTISSSVFKHTCSLDELVTNCLFYMLFDIVYCCCNRHIIFFPLDFSKYNADTAYLKWWNNVAAGSGT